MIVIDASLAVKWYVIEPQSEGARTLFGEHAGNIVVPDIFRAEVIGAMVRRANIDKSERTAADTSIAAFLHLFADGFLQLSNLTGPQMARAAQAALDLGHPLKDCLYLALAMDLGCPLVTCDAKFADRARRVYESVRVLEDTAGGYAGGTR